MVEPGTPLYVFLAKVLGVLVVIGVVTYLVIRVGYTFDLPGQEAATALRDLFILVVTLLVVSPVLHTWHVLWLLPIMVVRPSGIAWLALPVLVTLSYLTHLVGPDAADLTLSDGTFSFRVFEYGILGLLLVVDFVSRNRLFTAPNLEHHQTTGTEEDLLWESTLREEPEAAF